MNVALRGADADYTHGQKALFRKVTLRLLPILGLSYFIAYVDRVNVGFAKLTMAAHLGFSEVAFGFGAGIFFVGYVLFETPSNFLLEKFGARVWIARIMITWGLLSAACMFVNTEWQFYLLRFLVGVAEAGFLPGVLYFLSRWYPSARRGGIYSLFLLGLPLAGLFGAPLSGWIIHNLDAVLGLAGWQWLFLAEGAPAVMLGLAVLLTLPNAPRDAKWLTDQEKVYLEQIVESEGTQGQGHSFWEGVTDIRVWLLGLIDFGILLTTYSLSFWLPTFLKTAGVSDPQRIGLFAAIPSAATLVVMLGLGYSSDRMRERRWHLMIPFALGTLAIALFPLAQHSVAMLLLVATVASGAITGAVPVFFSLPATFLSGSAAAAGFAIACSVANIAGLLSNALVGLSLSLTGDASLALLPFAGFMLVAIAIVWSLPAKTVNR